MQTNMSIVGMPWLTITAFSSRDEDLDVVSAWNMKGEGRPIPEKLERANHFHIARKRFAAQGATDVTFHPV